MALAEARLVTAKLLWHFDMALDGEHEAWVDDARFYVSSHAILPVPLARQITQIISCMCRERALTADFKILWELQPLMIRFTSIQR